MVTMEDERISAGSGDCPAERPESPKPRILLIVDDIEHEESRRAYRNFRRAAFLAEGGAEVTVFRMRPGSDTTPSRRSLSAVRVIAERGFEALLPLLKSSHDQFDYIWATQPSHVRFLTEGEGAALRCAIPIILDPGLAVLSTNTLSESLQWLSAKPGLGPRERFFASLLDELGAIYSLAQCAQLFRRVSAVLLDVEDARHFDPELPIVGIAGWNALDGAHSEERVPVEPLKGILERALARSGDMQPVVTQQKAAPCADRAHVLHDLLKRDSGAPQTYVAEAATVILPVFNGVEHLKRCVASLCSNTDLPCRVFIVDDCSSDPHTEEFLNELPSIVSYGSLVEFFVVRNARNVGFVGSVNQVIPLAPGHVVLLNSDTEVPRNWLSRMIIALEKWPATASFTPYTNSGMVCSYPHPCTNNKIPRGFTLDEIDGLFQREFDARPLQIPTGVGFCMALNRTALDSIGYFDGDTFRGMYAEENDWCMRASYAGFSNALLPNLYVYHYDGGSVDRSDGGHRKRDLPINLKKLTLLHPGFDLAVRSHIAEDPFCEYRRFISSRLNTDFIEQSGILIFHNSSISGGAAAYLVDRIVEWRKVRPVFLFSVEEAGPKIVDLSVEEVFEFEFDKNHLDEINLAELMRVLRCNEIFVNHLIGADVAWMMRLIERSGAPYSVFCHDYFAACPNPTLLTADHVYCGAESDPVVCQRCIERGLSTDLIPIQQRRGLRIDEWRENFARFLSGAAAVEAPSKTAAAILRAYYAELRIAVVPHSVPNYVRRTFQAEFARQRELVVGIVGAIGPHKGARILDRIVDGARRAGLPVRFVVIGTTDEHDAPYVSPDGMFEVTGKYNRREISTILERYKTSIVFFPTTYPETYQYTADEALYSGYPVLSFALGAAADRVRSEGAGWLISPNDLSGVLACLDRLQRNRHEIIEKSWGGSSATGGADASARGA